MKQKTLKITDKKTIDKYLSYAQHELSAYNFANIFIWKKLYKISWAIIDENLCIFFRDKLGCFLYLPPLGKQRSNLAINEAFEEMDKINANREISRIENIEGNELEFFISMGFKSQEKPNEYVCNRKEIVELKGNKFKSKRASCNFFNKNYQHEIKFYQPGHKKHCLDLFGTWSAQRSLGEKDAVYNGMIEDSGKTFRQLLDNYGKLDILGNILVVEGKIKAFTFGYALNKDTFCILYEITDLRVKGAAQFIFREFCKSLKKYRFINIMDDSYLKNLKLVKESYHPEKIVPAYIVKKPIKHA